MQSRSFGQVRREYAVALLRQPLLPISPTSSTNVVRGLVRQLTTTEPRLSFLCQGGRGRTLINMLTVAQLKRGRPESKRRLLVDCWGARVATLRDEDGLRSEQQEEEMKRQMAEAFGEEEE